MTIASVKELQNKKCVPCEGGVPRIDRPDAERLLKGLPGWELADDGKLIRRKWTVKNFVAGLEFLNQIGALAEEEQHHPDVHLTGYRNVKVELMTHAIGGLSENDFILAAKIDQIPVSVKAV
jgi:4a-hydroxytetrahydrobiopterin dehydratase